MRKVKVLLALFCVFCFMQATPVVSAAEENLPEYIEFDGDVSQRYYDRMQKHYNLIPETVRNHFEYSDWKIVMTSGRVEELYYENGTGPAICALYCPDEKIIWLEDNRNGSASIIHEMGHYVANPVAGTYYDETEEWLDIWEREAKNVSKYAASNQWEGFAEMFEYMVLHPVKTAEKYPESYNYIMNICNSLQTEDAEGIKNLADVLQ